MKVKKDIREWQILTPYGWSDFDGISQTNHDFYLKINFSDGSYINCSYGHTFKIGDSWICASDVIVGDILYPDKTITEIQCIDDAVVLYDIIDVTNGNQYYTNGVVSHNCAFIHDIDEIWASAQPTLSTGGDCIAISCVTADTMVYTADGIKKIEHFIPSDETGPHHVKTYSVLGNKKTRDGVIFHNNGITTTKTLVTNHGLITGALPHKMWSYKDGTFGWHTLEQLERYDWVLLHLGMEQWGNNDDLSDFEPEILSSHINIIKPTEFTPHLVYLLTLCAMVGTSTRVYNKYKQYVGATIRITSRHDISDLLRTNNLNFKVDENGDFLIGSKSLHDLLDHLDVDLTLPFDQRCIPYRLLSLSRENVLAVVRAIYDEFVDIDGNTLIFTTRNLELSRQISMVMFNVGLAVQTYIRTTDGGVVYYMKIVKKDVKTFYKHIGFGYYKGDAVIKRTNQDPYTFIPNGQVIARELLDAYGKGVWNLYLDYNINFKNVTNRVDNMYTDVIVRDDLAHMYSCVKHLLTDEQVEYFDSIIAPQHKWIQIKYTEYGEEPTYDFSLPHDDSDPWCHSVVYNGMLGHQTPNGVGNWFHRYWNGAEEGTNTFNPIKLHWTVHPERDQSWRDAQDVELGPKLASQECDVSFISSGNTVIDPSTLEFYKETFVTEPIERTGFDGNLWRWEYPMASKSYIVVADVARGDGEDNSAAHVIEVETVSQVAEYRGKLDTKSFGNFLVSLATEYNQALLVVENSNIGWAAIQQIIDRNYSNLFYMSNDLRYVDVQHQLTNRLRTIEKNMVAGFSTTTRTRPLIISKLDDYFKDRSMVIRSTRLIEELFTFIYHNGRAEALRGYNDDLVIAFAIGLWIRDTALRLRHEGIDLTKSALAGITATTAPAFYGGNSLQGEDAWKYTWGDQEIDLRDWL